MAAGSDIKSTKSGTTTDFHSSITTNLTMTLDAREQRSRQCSISDVFADGRELRDYKVEKFSHKGPFTFVYVFLSPVELNVLNQGTHRHHLIALDRLCF